MEKLLAGVFNNQGKKGITVLKFGGKSLSNGSGLESVLQIISDKVAVGENIAVVLSAREKATDILESLLAKAAKGLSYHDAFEAFKSYQAHACKKVDLTPEFRSLAKLFEGVALLGDYSAKVKDEVLAYGELLSGKLVVALLQERGIKAQLLDSRKLIVTCLLYTSPSPRDS